MEYLPKYRLCFIHIPKNAGQSVRAALRVLGDTDQAPIAADLGVPISELKTTLARPWTHPVLGPVHVTHLPLVVLRDYFPHCWEAFSTSRSFCLTRPPRDRFVSALMQRLQEFGRVGTIQVGDPLVREEAGRVCERLSGATSALTEAQYAHFSKQTDFTDIGGVRNITTVFPMDGSDAIETWLSQDIGLSLSIERTHFRRQPKSWARSVLPAARFAGRRLMPRALKRKIYPLWTGSPIFDNARESYASIDLGQDVEAFIADHYAGDAALHAEALAAAAALRSHGAET